MIALKIAMVLLMFTTVMSLVTHSGIFTPTPSYYESEWLKSVNASRYQNISEMTENQASSYSVGVLDVIIGGISFEWLRQYVVLFPADTQSTLNSFITGLDILMGFFISIAVVEILWTKQTMFGFGEK